jgi:hypothetical protein
LSARTEAYEAALAKAGVSTKALGKQVESVGTRGTQKVSDLTNGFVNLSGKAAAGIGVAVTAGGALLTVLKAGVDGYTRLAEQVDAYQDVTGSSAEESSKMVAIADAFGVSTDALAQNMAKLGRTVTTNADSLHAYGVEVARNADGTVDLTGTLTNVAAAYQAAGGGAEGLAVAQAAFGRGGAAMIDILERQRQEIDGVTAAAEKHGRIISDEDIQAALDYKVAMRELGDAVDELRIAAGKDVVPGLTSFAKDTADAIDKSKPFLDDLVGLLKTATNPSNAGHWIKDLVGDHDDAAAAAHEHAEAEEALAIQAAESAQEIAEYSEAIRQLIADHFAVSSAQDSYNDKLLDFVDQVRSAQVEGDDFAASLDRSRQSGIDNADALRDLVTAHLAVIEAMKTQGSSQDAINVATMVQREQLSSVLQQLGFNRAAAANYLDVLLQVPQSLGTVLHADTAEAEAKLARVLSLLGAIQRAEHFTNLNVLSGRTATPAGGSGDLAAYLRGGGPATIAAREAASPSSGGGGGTAKDPAEELRKEQEAWLRAADEFHRNQYAHHRESLEENVAYWNSRLGQEREGSAAWFQILDERDRVLDEHADAEQAERDRQAQNVEAWMRAQDEFERNMFEHGMRSVDQYKQYLQARLAATVEYSSDYFSILDEIADLDAQHADDVQRAQDKAVDRLNDLLDEQIQIRSKMADLEQAHNSRMADLGRKYNADQQQILDDRTQQLLGWADVSQRVTVQWGNSVGALTRNVRDQMTQFAEWADALTAARARGVSDAVIDLLGLDDGPQALGQVRMFLNATDAEIAALNAAVADRQRQAGAEVAAEASSSVSDIAEQLTDLHDAYTAEVEALTSEFLTSQQALSVEMAAVGADQGRSYGQAIADGLASAVPAIRAAAQAAQAAMTGGTYVSARPIVGAKTPVTAMSSAASHGWVQTPVHVTAQAPVVEVYVDGVRTIDDRISVKLRERAGVRSVVAAK